MIAKEIKSKSGRERARKKPKVAFENNWNCWFKNGFYVSVVIHARKSLFFPKRVYNHRSVRSFFVSQFFVLKQWWVSKIKQYLTKKNLSFCCLVVMSVLNIGCCVLLLENLFLPKQEAFSKSKQNQMEK